LDAAAAARPFSASGFAQVEAEATIVRFEDMIEAPLAFARGVCDELGLDAGAEQATLEQWAARVQNTNNAAFVEAWTSRGYSRPEHAVRVERWRENLTPEDVDLVWPIVARPAARFGYERSPTQASMIGASPAASV